MTRTQLYENFAKNIELERNRLSLTQKKMADALHISLSKYKILITNPFEANIDIYLAHQIQKLTNKTVRELCGDDLPELEMLRYFRELPKHRQEAIRYMIELEYQFPTDSLPNANEEDYTTCYVPTGNMTDGMILDSRDFITVNIVEYKKRCNNELISHLSISEIHLKCKENPCKGVVLCVAQEPFQADRQGVPRKGFPSPSSTRNATRWV